MKSFWIAPLAAIFVLSGCGSSDASMSPAQEKASRDAFHAKPDINTLPPEMRKRVEAMMAASKTGTKPTTGTTTKP